MLITCKSGIELVKILNEQGIESRIIGSITNSKGIIVDNGLECEVIPPEADELFNL
jgi:hypothetical protein